MAHKVFAGPFPSLERRLVQEVADQQKDNPLAPVAVLVGSNVLAAYLRRRIAERGRTAANVRFHTFIDLVLELGREAAAPASKPRIPSLGAHQVLDTVLGQRIPEVFARVAGLGGFRSSLLDTLRDLRDAGISPTAFDSALRRIAFVSPSRARHLSGLGDIYRRYREGVSRFEDIDDDFHRAIANASEAPEILGSRRLYIYGLYDVTGQQEDLLNSLKDHLEMVYFIPYVNDAASGFVKNFLQARITGLDAECRQIQTDSRKDSLGRLADRIFGGYREDSGPISGRAATPAGKPEMLEEDGSFALVSVPGASRVAVEVVREILHALRDGLITGFHEAAVILRHHRDEAPALAEAFRLRGIPYYIQGGSPFARRPLARAVLALLRLETESFSRKSILAAMEMIGAALPTDAAPLWDVSRWRSLTNEARFLSGVPSWDEATGALCREKLAVLHSAQNPDWPDSEDDGNGASFLTEPMARAQAEAAEGLRGAWEFLRAAAAEWPGQLGWREWAGFLRSRLQPVLGEAEDWESFSSVLDLLASLGEGEELGAWSSSVSRAAMEAALGNAMADLSYPEGQFEKRGVNLLAASAARGLLFPLVIVPGLDEGRFPSRLRQDPLLLDEERRRIGRLALKSLRGEEEKLLFDMAVRSAQKRLVLITSRLDENADRERIPSDFFLRAAGAARGGSVGLRDLREGILPGFRSVSLEDPSPRARQVAVDPGEVRLRLITENPGLRLAARAALAKEEPALMRGPMAYDQARWSRNLTAFDGRIRDPALLRWISQRLAAEGGQVSASRFEEYAKCPYLFYLKRCLGLQGWEELEPALSLDPLVRGRIIHSILEDFLKGLDEPLHSTDPDSLAADLSRDARAALERSRPPGLPDLLWEIEREALVRILRRWLDYERNRLSEGWKPAYMERAFGSFRKEEPRPAFRVEASGHTFEFRGRIDRIDVSEDGARARVIDYKTGQAPKTMEQAKRTLLMGGEKIQLAVYGGALSVFEDMAGVEKVEGEYLHLQVHNETVVSFPYTAEELQEALRRLPEVLQIIVSSIQKGVFFAQTSGTVHTNGHCRYCDYLSVCGKDRLQREERKSGDREVAAVRRIRAVDSVIEDLE